MRPGLDVEISFPAFNHAQTPNVPGKVLTVSADRLEDEDSKTPYYLAQIEVTPEGVDALSTNTIRPGMPDSVLIRTGERTMPRYLDRKKFGEEKSVTVRVEHGGRRIIKKKKILIES